MLDFPVYTVPEKDIPESLIQVYNNSGEQLIFVPHCYYIMPLCVYVCVSGVLLDELAAWAYIVTHEH